MKTLNKAVARYNGISLIVRILVGLIIGAVLALVAPGAGWVGELGNLFVGALKGIAPVLVFVIVASALAQGSSKLDRRFGTVIWLYMLTTFLIKYVHNNERNQTAPGLLRRNRPPHRAADAMFANR